MTTTLPPHIATADEPIEILSGDRWDGPDMRLVMPIDAMIANLHEFAIDDVGYLSLWRKYLAAAGLSLLLHIDKDGERHLQVSSPCDPQVRHRSRWLHYLIRDLDAVEERRPLLMKTLERERNFWDDRPVNARAVTAAIRGFLNADGRILLTPEGHLTEGRDVPQVFLNGTRKQVAICIAANRAYFDVQRRFKADLQIKRAVQMLGHRTSNGWMVLEAPHA